MPSLGLLVALAAFAPQDSLVPPVQAGPQCDVQYSIDPQEERMLQLINEHRTNHGLHRLVFSDTLNRAAAWKSRDMATRNYFGHDDLGTNRGFVDRIRDCGYTENAHLAENIAAGHASADMTFEQWLARPGHNAVMLSPNMAAVGIARSYSPSAEWGWYWTAAFGGVADGYSPPTLTTAVHWGDANCDGRTNSVDAAFVLQYTAGMLASLPCPSEADVDGNGRIDAVDASIILQVAAGMFG